MTEQQTQQKSETRVVRILGKDIEGRMNIYTGLTKIKGVSWTLSNATCTLLGIEKTKTIGSLTDQEMETVTSFLKNPQVPEYMLNRRQDHETGLDKHLIGVDLELANEFDVKRLKKIKSYRGFRHMAGLPMRGQRTKSNFRMNRRKGAGIKKKTA